MHLHPQVASALQTFRPDVVNQLSGAMSLELRRLRAGSADAVAVRQSLMTSLLNALPQVIIALLTPFHVSKSHERIFVS
jgi:hypothetical protein